MNLSRKVKTGFTKVTQLPSVTFSYLQLPPVTSSYLICSKPLTAFCKCSLFQFIRQIVVKPVFTKVTQWVHLYLYPPPRGTSTPPRFPENKYICNKLILYLLGFTSLQCLCACQKGYNSAHISPFFLGHNSVYLSP